MNKQQAFNGGNITGISFNLYGYDDLKKTTESNILRAFNFEFKNDIKMLLEKAGLKLHKIQWYNPKYYNFEGDSLDFVISIQDKTKLLNYVDLHSVEIQKYFDNNKSYDGYMALTCDTVKQAKQNINDDDDIDIMIINSILSALDFSDFDISEYFDYYKSYYN
jgi:hypothetical protein